MAGKVTVDHIEAAQRAAAEVVGIDAAALPVFDRLDRELEAARAETALSEVQDPVERARELSRIRKTLRGAD